MNCPRIMYAGCCLTLGASCVFYGIHIASKFPAIVLIKTSAIPFLVAVLVGLATNAIFANFNHPAKDLIIHFGTVIYAHKFTVLIASGFGIASATVWIVYLIALLLWTGLTSFHTAFLWDR